MKKKLLAMVFLVVAICVGISMGKGIAHASAAEITSSETNTIDYFENSNRSVAIYDEAMSSYKSIVKGRSGKEVVTYTDDFAGVFIDDDGFLNIGLVGLQESASNFDGQVKYRQYEFTYNYLQDVQETVTDIMPDYGIHMVGIDEKSNAVSIYLNDYSEIETVISLLTNTYDLNDHALKFVVDESGGIIQNTIAYGGESISRIVDATTISRGTMCVNAIDNTTGQLGILTNEHVALAANNTQNSYRGHRNPTTGAFGTNIVLGNALRGQHSGTVDAAFVPFANQEDWEITPYGRYNTTSYTNVRLGNNNQIIQGRAVRKIGQTSGVTDGTITHAATTVTLNYGTQANPNNQTITDVFRYSNESLGGDSGGPVYFNDGTNLFLIGMNFAGPADPSTATFGIACRIQNVINTLNVTPITNDSFSTSNDGSGVSIDGINFSPNGAINIPTAVRGRTVTKIGDSAFSNQRQMYQVSIPSSVTSIGGSAFSGCGSLTGVTFEAGSLLRSVGRGAFQECGNLTNFSLPSTVTGIAVEAFQDCARLASLTLPASVASVGANAFSGCTDLAITWNYNPAITAANFRERLTAVTFPAGTRAISANAFQDCAGLTSIAIPASVTSIGESAFSGCGSLTDVTFGAGSMLTRIDDSAFYHCDSIASLAIPASVTSVGDSAFYYCRNMESAAFGTNSGLERLGDYAFAYCLELRSAAFGTNSALGRIGAYAFQNCVNLTSIAVPAAVESVGNYAFGGCYSLGSVTFEAGSRLWSVARGAFQECVNLTNFSLPPSVTSIAVEAFSGCARLASLTLPASVTSVGSNAFSGCEALKITWNYNPAITAANFRERLTAVTFPAGTQGISANAFSGCTGLKSLTLPLNLTSIGNGAFSDCTGLTDLRLGRVESIGTNAFQNCRGLTRIDLASSLSTIGANAFKNCTGLTSVTVPKSVTSIGSSAFSGCSGLREMTLPFTGASISGYTGNAAKFGYIFGTASYAGGTSTNQSGVTYYIPSALRKVTVTGGQIGFYAFYGCAGLTEAALEDGVTGICESAFERCTGLTKINIGNGVTTIMGYAFYGCTGLLRIAVPESVTILAVNAFAGCNNLTNITLPFVGLSVNSGSNTHFGHIFGAPNSSVQNSYIPASLKSVTIERSAAAVRAAIPGTAFYGCTGLETVTVRGNTDIGNSAFVFCGGLKRVTIGEGVTAIGDSAFVRCTSLTSVSIAGTVTGIGASAFASCTSLSEITIPASVESMGATAFGGCTALQTVSAKRPAPDVTGLGASAFSGCNSLGEIRVDADSVAAYKSAAGWSVYAGIITTEKTELLTGGEAVFFSGADNGAAKAEVRTAITSVSGYGNTQGLVFYYAIRYPDGSERTGSLTYARVTQMGSPGSPAIVEVYGVTLNDPEVYFTLSYVMIRDAPSYLPTRFEYNVTLTARSQDVERFVVTGIVV